MKIKNFQDTENLRFSSVSGNGKLNIRIFAISAILAFPGCHTQAKTMDELIKRTKEAIKAIETS